MSFKDFFISDVKKDKDLGGGKYVAYTAPNWLFGGKTELEKKQKKIDTLQHEFTIEKQRAKAVIQGIANSFNCSSYSNYVKNLKDESAKGYKFENVDNRLTAEAMRGFKRKEPTLMSMYYQLSNNSGIKKKLLTYLQTKLKDVDKLEKVDSSAILTKIKKDLLDMIKKLKDQIVIQLKKQEFLAYLTNKKSGLDKILKKRFEAEINNPVVTKRMDVAGWQNDAIEQAINIEIVKILNPSNRMTKYRLYGSPFRADPNSGDMLKNIWKDSNKHFASLVVKSKIVDNAYDKHEQARRDFREKKGKQKALQVHFPILRQEANMQNRTKYTTKSIWNGWINPVLSDVPIINQETGILLKETAKLESIKKKEKPTLPTIDIQADVIGGEVVFNIKGKKLAANLKSKVKRRLQKSYGEAWLSLKMAPGQISLNKEEVSFKKAFEGLAKKELRDLGKVKLTTNIHYEVQDPMLQIEVIGYAGIDVKSGMSEEAVKKAKKLASTRAAAVARNLELPLENITQKAKVMGQGPDGKPKEIKRVKDVRATYEYILHAYREKFNKQQKLMDDVQSGVSGLINLIQKFAKGERYVNPQQATFLRKYIFTYEKVDIRISPPEKLEVNMASPSKKKRKKTKKMKRRRKYV